MKSLICNLKMNHQLKEMIEYKKVLEENQIDSLIIAPAFCYLPLMHSKKYKLCAQNVSRKEKENHTGSISVEALKSLDVHAVLVGHFETKDTWDDILEKIEHITKYNSKSYIILSDTKEEFDYQYTTTKLLEKMDSILQKIPKEKYHLLTFIYEPSWLVGTKTPLDVEIANNIIYQIKKELKNKYDVDFQIFYGGGLTLETIESFLNSSYIDGLLLGSISFDVKNIVKMIKKENFRQN